MTPHAPASPDTIDMTAVGRGVGRRVPLLLVLAGLAGGLTAGILSTMAPQYLSQAQLEIRGANPTDAGGRPDKEAVGTHVRGLMSTALALKMSKELRLTERAEFNSALEPDDLYGRTIRWIGLSGPKPGETDEDRLMQAYFKSVRAYQVRDTRSVIVDCTSQNARFAADCANKLADLYRDSLSGRVVIENTDVKGKLAPQVERLARETAEAEAQAAEFRGKANLFQGSSQSTQLKDQQLSELTAELTRATTVRGEADARAAAAREMSARGMAAANPDVQKSALIPRMEEQRVTLERQIAELSATLLPGHPRMKQLSAELAGLQTQIRAEVLKMVESLANDARIAAEREAGTRRRVEDLKRTVVSSAPDSARLAQLENQAHAKRAELERVQRQFEAAGSSAGAGVTASEVEIVSRAYPSNEKVFPKIGSMASLAAVGAFIIGLALTITIELVNGARPNRAALTAPSPHAGRAAPAPTPTPMPTPMPSPGPKTTPVGPSDTDVTAPALEPAATALSIARSAAGMRGFRVLLAASNPSIDATSTAVALARALGNGGAGVVLLAWAGSGSTLADIAGLKAAPGTAQLLAGAASLEEAIQHLPGSDIAVVTAGAGPGAAIDGDSAAMVLDALDETYDFVVVVGTPTVARGLFEAIQGRFDAGVLVGEAPTTDGSAQFLGFMVPDFQILHMAAVADDGGYKSRRQRVLATA